MSQAGVERKLSYRIIPNKSTECLDKSQGGGYIREYIYTSALIVLSHNDREV